MRITAMTQRVLIVEDDALNGMLFEESLRHNGFETQLVTDGNHVLRAVNRFEPHLIMMDIGLPHVSGLELIEQLKARANTVAIPILAISGYAAEDVKAEVTGAGADGYLVKPVATEVMMREARRILGPGAQTSTDAMH